MEKVCVLMSTYNGEKYLKTQIDSIIKQKNVEVLLYIRDDGSNDNTKKILKLYKNKFKNIEIIFGKNIGVKNSFFELLKLAPKSKYYAFSDQDDYWKSDKLYIAIRKIKDDKLLYFCKKKLVDKNLNSLYIEDEDVNNINLGATIMKGFASGCTMVFSDKLKKEVLKFDISNFSMHDTLLLKVASCFPNSIFYDKNEYILYRQHENNVVGSTVLKKKLYLKNIIMFIKNKKYLKTRRFESAEELYREYNEILSKNDKKNLLLFINSKNNILLRIRLCLKRFISGQNLKETFIFKCRFLLGMI